MLRRGAVVVDVGINVVDGELVGDVDFESAAAGRVRDHAGPGRRRSADERAAARPPGAGRPGPGRRGAGTPRRPADDSRALPSRSAEPADVTSRGASMTLPVGSRDRPLRHARGPIIDVAARPRPARRRDRARTASTKAKVTLAGDRAPRGRAARAASTSSSPRSRPTPLGEGKSTTTVGLAQGLNQIGQQGGGLHPPAVARPGVRDQGRRRRRRLQPGHPDGGLQPPPDRRRPRDRRGPQPRGGVPRQPPPPRQRPRHRPVLDPLAAGRRHQRPGGAAGRSSASAARRTAFPARPSS